MTTSSSSKNPPLPQFLTQVANLSQESPNLHTKLGLLSLITQPNPILLDKILLLYEHLQLLCQILLVSLLFQNPNENPFSTAFVLATRFINPVSWISFVNLAPFIIMIIFTISKYLLLLIISMHKKSQEGKFLMLWQWLFRTQGRILYFLTTSFYLNTILTVDWTSGTPYKRTQNKAIMVIGLLGIILEFGLSLGLFICYHNLLPTKSFLASKSNIIETINLVQKLVLQIIFVSLNNISLASLWVIIIISLAFDLFRNLIFFTSLPLYNFKALKYQATLLMIITSLNLGCLTLLISRAIDPSTNNLRLLLSLWAIIAICLVKVARTLVRQRFLDLLLKPDITSPNLLIHRISAIKQLKKLTTPHHEFNDKYSWTLLASKSVFNVKNIAQIFGELDVTALDNVENSLDFMIQHYLKRLCEKYPKNALVQLYAAKFFAKKLKIYSEVSRITTLLQNNKTPQVKITAELLLLQIQNAMKTSSLPATALDAHAFISEQALLAKFKSLIILQASKQLKVYEEIQKDHPSLVQIIDLSQDVSSSRERVQKHIKIMLQGISDFNYLPLFLCAQYSLLINHTIIDYLSYFEAYTHKTTKYRKAINDDKLTMTNVFQENTSFITFSGQSSTLGNIILASKSSEKIFGGDTHIYSGQKIESKMPPCLQSYFSGFLKSLSENKNTEELSQITRGFCYNQDGFLVQIDYSIFLHPFVAQGFQFIFLARAVLSDEEDFILVHENGEIDCATKSISKKLGLKKPAGQRVKVREISNDLAVINEAFNITAAVPKKGTQLILLSKEEADEVYSLYTTTGKDILLSLIDSPGNKLSYHCKASSSFYGSTLIKTLTLKENKSENLLLERSLSQEPDNFSDVLLNNYEEKEEGWIDFESLTSRGYTTSTTRRNLLTETPRAYTPRPLIALTTTPQEIPAVKLPPQPAIMTSSPRKNKPTDPHKIATSLHTSNYSRLSQKKYLANSFKAALHVNYIPKLFKALSLAFYLSLLIIIISQIVLTAVLDENTEDLLTRKDVVRNALERNFLSITIHGLLRIIWDVKTGAMNPLDYQSLAPGIQVYQDVMDMYIITLTQANQELMENTKNFDDNINSLLFSRDVKIYDTYFTEPVQSYIELNTFQATDRIIETALAFINYNGPVTSHEANDRALFLYRNTLNDLILKNQNISAILVQILHEQHEKMSTNIHICLFGLVTLLGLVLIGIFFGFVKQSSKQERNMTAFCRIPTQKISLVQKRCREFNEILINGDMMLSPQDATTYTSITMRTRENHKAAKQEGKREAQKTPKTQEIYTRNYKEIGKLASLCIILITLVVLFAKLDHHSINSFQEKQNQVSLIGYLKARLSLAFQATRELLISNNTAMVENRLGSEEIPLLIKELTNLRINIYNSILNSEAFEQSVEIRDLLFGDPCPYLGAGSAFQCMILQQLGKKGGIIYLLSEFENEFTRELQAYLDSDKSEAALNSIKIRVFDSTSVMYIIAITSLQAIEEILNEQLEDQIKHVGRQRTALLVLFLMIIVVVGFLAWLVVLRGLKESLNKFKNVLKTLPPEVIFLSFLLKGFLVKTSKGALDSVKNQI